MNEQELIESLTGLAGDVPEQVEVFAVKPRSMEEMTHRLRQLIQGAGKLCQAPLDRGDWVRSENRTRVRLPMGARATLYHASGAIELVGGLAPMEALFERADSQEALTRMVDDAAGQLGIDDGMGPHESLVFERLWQIKAAAADRQRMVEPVLCRIVGAYRQFVGSLPVLGRASVALKLAAGGVLDRVSIVTRPPADEPFAWAPTRAPEHAAAAIVAELGSLMGRSGTPFAELARPRAMHLGYLGLGRRQSQSVLAPHYVAFIDIEGQEAQGVQLVTSATDRTFMGLCQSGAGPLPPEQARKPAMLRTKAVDPQRPAGSNQAPACQ